jgi:hypothetical protein
MGNNTSNSYNLKFVVVSDKQKAQTLLDSAETEDFYLEECHDDKVNSLARKNLTYVANSISLRDNNYAISYLDGTKDFLPIRLLNDLRNIQIIQLMPSADGGMPHTRPGDIICYPNIEQLFSKTTLIHELWHIHQRNYKDIWFKTFKRMGWTMWNGQLPESLDKARRYNPDTLDCPFWIFENEWIPLPIFRDISRPNVSDVEIWFYNPHRQYHIKRIPESLKSYIPGLPLTAYEHPREITAYMLSEPEKYKDSDGFKHLIESIGEISIMLNKNENNY